MARASWEPLFASSLAIKNGTRRKMVLISVGTGAKARKYGGSSRVGDHKMFLVPDGGGPFGESIKWFVKILCPALVSLRSQPDMFALFNSSLPLSIQAVLLKLSLD
jgi:hypothetical protein